MKDESKKKAWVTAWAGLPELTGIVPAETRSKAIKACFDSVDDAGYRPLRWIDFTAKREPKYDAWASTQTRTGCYTGEYVEQQIAAQVS